MQVGMAVANDGDEVMGFKINVKGLKVLYVEIDSAIYFNSSQVSDVNGVKSKVLSVLNTFSRSNINKFGGRFK